MFLINSLAGGGAERVTALLANQWVASGHDVTVASFSDTSADVYALSPTVERLVLGHAGRPPGMMPRPANLLRLRNLRRVLSQHRPDAVIGMMTPAAVLTGIVTSTLTGIVAIGAERCHPPHRPLGGPREFARKHVYAGLDVVVAQTNETAQWLRSNTRARRVEVIPNPVTYPIPIGRPSVDPAHVVSADRRVVLSAGRLIEGKDFVTLIRAFSILAPSVPEWDLVILGGGPLADTLHALAEERGVADRVHLPGRVGNMATWYDRADVFAFPSRSEGFPNALLEALSHGLPSVSTDCDAGPRDLIQPGHNGLLVPVGDEESMATAMAAVIEDESTRTRMGAAATEARTRYEVTTIANRWLELIQSVER